MKIKKALRTLALGYYAYRCVRLKVTRGACFPPEAVMALRFRPKLDKIVELLLYLAHVRPGADKYQAVKFFYLADREHLNRYGRPITFENYYALSYGPVASKALDLLEDDARVLKEAGIDRLPFETEVGKLPNGNDTVYLRKPLRQVNYELFSKSDLNIFDDVVRKYRNASFDDLFKLTHKHYAYTKAWSTRKQGNRAEMFYEEMIDDEKKRAALVEELLPVASHMQ
ncbi:MAG TPA: Panacea domain-containing protein [Roseiarcus sp.]|nr:Panacea domain-containing protein [Roseiarcus sp.]